MRVDVDENLSENDAMCTIIFGGGNINFTAEDCVLQII